MASELLEVTPRVRVSKVCINNVPVYIGVIMLWLKSGLSELYDTLLATT